MKILAISVMICIVLISFTSGQIIIRDGNSTAPFVEVGKVVSSNGTNYYYTNYYNVTGESIWVNDSTHVWINESYPQNMNLSFLRLGIDQQYIYEGRNYWGGGLLTDGYDDGWGTGAGWFQMASNGNSYAGLTMYDWDRNYAGSSDRQTAAIWLGGANWGTNANTNDIEVWVDDEYMGTNLNTVYMTMRAFPKITDNIPGLWLGSRDFNSNPWNYAQPRYALDVGDGDTRIRGSYKLGFGGDKDNDYTSAISDDGSTMQFENGINGFNFNNNITAPNVCYADGTNCTGTDLTNIAYTNITNNFTATQNISQANLTITPTYSANLLTNGGTFDNALNCTNGSGWKFENNVARRFNATGGYLTCNVTGLAQNKSYLIEFGLSNVSTRGLFYVYLGSATEYTDTADGWIDTTFTMQNTTYSMTGYTIRPKVGTNVIQLYSAGIFDLDNLSVKEISNGEIQIGTDMVVGQGYIKRTNNKNATITKFYKYYDGIYTDKLCVGTICEYTFYSELFNVPNGGRIGGYTFTNSLTNTGCGTSVDGQSCSATGRNNVTINYWGKNNTWVRYDATQQGTTNRTFPVKEYFENMSRGLGGNPIGLPGAGTNNKGAGDIFYDYMDANYTQYYLSDINVGGRGWNNLSNVFRKTESYNFSTNTTTMDTNVQVNGNLTGNTYYSGMYMHNDTGGSFPFGSSSTWYNFTNLTCGLTNGFTCNGTSGTLIAGVGGVYKVNYIATGIGSNNHVYHLAVAINGVTQNNTESHAMASAGDTITMSGLGHITITAGNIINLQIQDASGTGTGTVYNANIVLERIGN